MHLSLTVECITSGLHLSVFSGGPPFARTTPLTDPREVLCLQFLQVHEDHVFCDLGLGMVFWGC